MRGNSATAGYLPFNFFDADITARAGRSNGPLRRDAATRHAPE